MGESNVILGFLVVFKKLKIIDTEQARAAYIHYQNHVKSKLFK